MAEVAPPRRGTTRTKGGTRIAWNRAGRVRRVRVCCRRDASGAARCVGRGDGGVVDGGEFSGLVGRLRAFSEAMIVALTSNQTFGEAEPITRRVLRSMQAKKPINGYVSSPSSSFRLVPHAPNIADLVAKVRTPSDQHAPAAFALSDDQAVLVMRSEIQVAGGSMLVGDGAVAILGDGGVMHAPDMAARAP